MNYIDTLKSPRRRLTIVAAVVALHVVMIYGWFTLKPYGWANRKPGLIRVDIVADMPIQHHAHGTIRPVPH